MDKYSYESASRGVRKHFLVDISEIYLPRHQWGKIKLCCNDIELWAGGPGTDLYWCLCCKMQNGTCCETGWVRQGQGRGQMAEDMRWQMAVGR